VNDLPAPVVADAPVSVVANRLFRRAIEMASEARTSGRVTPQTRVEPYWQFKDFRYGPDGPIPGNGSVVPKEVLDWSKAAQEVLENLKKTPEYAELLAELETTDKAMGIVPAVFLEANAREFLAGVLENLPASTDSSQAAADLLEIQLRGLPIPHGVNFRLGGLVVLGGPVTLRHRDLTIVLRATERADVERSASGAFFAPGFLRAPDCVAEIRLSGRPFADAQAQEQRLATILRLHSGAPLAVIATEMFAGPGRRNMGMMWPSTTAAVWRKATISGADQPTLQRFWERLSEQLPPSFVSPGQPALDAVSVAYERFKESIENGQVFEKCVTNAVMALEALYFKPSGEQAELTYRLSMRASRYLAHLGKDPARTRETIELAYDVRSEYVHGGRTSQKERKKIERLYTSLKTFQTELLDLVRISILAGVLHRVDKEEFVDLIDDSLIDPGKGARLEAITGEARNLLGISAKVG